MIILSKDQILQLHMDLIKATGGSDGIRDEGMLDSALGSPFQSFGGIELYPSVQAKAARLCFGLVKNHAMLDGKNSIGQRNIKLKTSSIFEIKKPDVF